MKARLQKVAVPVWRSSLLPPSNTCTRRRWNNKRRKLVDLKPRSERRFAMPWTANDAQTHTHKATTSELRELWAKVANERLEKTGNEGRAIREANAVVARQAERS
jgi:hypothetical protein